MPLLPAICDTCQTVWLPNAIRVENSSGISISDVAVSPCPTCGGIGHIPDGVYSATTDTIEVIATTVRSAQSLARLHAVVKRAQRERADAERLAHLLENESAEFKPVAEAVRRQAKRIDIKNWIGIALAVIAILQAQATDKKIDDIKAQVDHIYAQVVNDQPAPPQSKPMPTTPNQVGSVGYPKIGRNDQCPCGSGRKYKRCHGQ